MRVEEKGPVWDRFEALETEGREDPADPIYTLFMGRELAYYLVDGVRSVWTYVGDWGESLEWEVDGVVTRAEVKGRGGADDGDGKDGEDG